MPTLHIALYCSGDRMNTPHKEKKQKRITIIKAISCHHSVQEHHCSKNVMLEKNLMTGQGLKTDTHSMENNRLS